MRCCHEALSPCIICIVLGRDRGFSSREIKDAVNDLVSRYEALIFDCALSPSLIGAFHDRLRHAEINRRDPKRFIREEEMEFQHVESEARKAERTETVQREIQRRRIAGESFADKVLDEYRQRIEHYPEVDIHPKADIEVAKLYGAMAFFDSNHWANIEGFLRKAFPRTGQIDRMSIEQRFWRFVPTRKDRLAEELEPYRQILSTPLSTKKERIKAAQECVKAAAFFLHDLLNVCDKASREINMDPLTEDAVHYAENIIANFRIKDLKRH